MEFPTLVNVEGRRTGSTLQSRWICDGAGVLRLTWEVVERESIAVFDAAAEGIGSPVVPLMPVREGAAAA